jgi:hypothetical protein
MSLRNLFILQKTARGDLVVMSIEAFEKREQLLRLRSKLMIAEQSRLAGESTVSLSEAKRRLNEKYDAEV